MVRCNGVSGRLRDQAPPTCPAGVASAPTTGATFVSIATAKEFGENRDCRTVFSMLKLTSAEPEVGSGKESPEDRRIFLK